MPARPHHGQGVQALSRPAADRGPGAEDRARDRGRAQGGQDPDLECRLRPRRGGGDPGPHPRGPSAPRELAVVDPRHRRRRRGAGRCRAGPVRRPGDGRGPGGCGRAPLRTPRRAVRDAARHQGAHPLPAPEPGGAAARSSRGALRRDLPAQRAHLLQRRGPAPGRGLGRAGPGPAGMAVSGAEREPAAPRGRAAAARPRHLLLLRMAEPPSPPISGPRCSLRPPGRRTCRRGGGE